MPRYAARILSSLVSLILLLVMVFFLSRLTGDPQRADDLLQETYYRFLRAGAEYESDDHQRHALYRIAINVARDAHRRDRRRGGEVPLGPAAVRRIVDAVEPFTFDRIHGAFWDLTIARDAQAAVARSAERYLRAIG